MSSVGVRMEVTNGWSLTLNEIFEKEISDVTDSIPIEQIT